MGQIVDPQADDVLVRHRDRGHDLYVLQRRGIGYLIGRKPGNMIQELQLRRTDLPYDLLHGPVFHSRRRKGIHEGPFPVQYPCQLLFIYGIGQKLHKALLTGFLADAFREAYFFLDLSKGLIGEVRRLLRILLDHLIQIFFVFAEICKPVLERL